MKPSRCTLTIWHLDMEGRRIIMRVKLADKLQRNGDLEGYTAWSRVADAVERRAGKSVNVGTVTPAS
jgi:hypothetical protein